MTISWSSRSPGAVPPLIWYWWTMDWPLILYSLRTPWSAQWWPTSLMEPIFTVELLAFTFTNGATYGSVICSCNLKVEIQSMCQCITNLDYRRRERHQNISGLNQKMHSAKWHYRNVEVDHDLMTKCQVPLISLIAFQAK